MEYVVLVESTETVIEASRRVWKVSGVTSVAMKWWWTVVHDGRSSTERSNRRLRWF
ncbi:hypothetical protein Hanom_Chr11g00996461 [Helianthus anomalus]